MWIFTTRGFVSIVAYPPAMLDFMVRARFKRDIEALFPGISAVETPDRDYRYRALVPKHLVTEVIADAVADINYENFKDACPEDRHDVYLDVWCDMYREQLRRTPRPKRYSSFGGVVDSLDAVSDRVEQTARPTAPKPRKKKSATSRNNKRKKRT